MCVSNPISHHNFAKWDPIVTNGDTRVFYVISREISGVSGYVKGQGQGHQKHEMHWLSLNFWTGCHRDFWLVAFCSLFKVAFVTQSLRV